LRKIILKKAPARGKKTLNGTEQAASNTFVFFLYFFLHKTFQNKESMDI